MKANKAEYFCIIEDLRRDMHDLAADENTLFNELIKKSQELDKVLNKYSREQYSKK